MAKMHTRLTSFFYLPLRGADFLLFYGQSIRVESTELLGLLPCEDAIRSRLVLCTWHLILFYGREIGEVRSSRWRTHVGDLDRGGQDGV